jgi:hypothetical protein
MKQTFDENVNHTDHAQISLNIRDLNLIIFRFLATMNTFEIIVENHIESKTEESPLSVDYVDQFSSGRDSALTETCQDMQMKFSGTSF